jgi:hypothetical protein
VLDCCWRREPRGESCLGLASPFVVEASRSQQPQNVFASRAPSPLPIACTLSPMVQHTNGRTLLDMRTLLDARQRVHILEEDEHTKGRLRSRPPHTMYPGRHKCSTPSPCGQDVVMAGMLPVTGSSAGQATRSQTHILPYRVSPTSISLHPSTARHATHHPPLSYINNGSSVPLRGRSGHARLCWPCLCREPYAPQAGKEKEGRREGGGRKAER